MLKLQVKEPGEYLMIGDDIKIVFTGWTKNYLRIMVDAPKEVPVVRSKAAEKAGKVEPNRYLGDKELMIKRKEEEKAALMMKEEGEERAALMAKQKAEEKAIHIKNRKEEEKPAHIEKRKKEEKTARIIKQKAEEKAAVIIKRKEGKAAHERREALYRERKLS